MYAQKLTRQPGDGGQPVAWPVSHPWRLAVAYFFLIVVQLMFVIEGAGKSLGARCVDRPPFGYRGTQNARRHAFDLT
jgi:hypothetical protein